MNQLRLLLFVIGAVLFLSACGRRGGPGDLFGEPAGSPYKIGSSPNTLAIADFSGDGKLDLAIPSADDNNITLLLGNGTGAFATSTSGPSRTGAAPASVVVGDFNQDGKLDLATGNHDSSDITVLLGNGKGGFTPAPSSPIKIPVHKFWRGPARPLYLAVGDFNADGRPDLAAANLAEDNVTVLLATGGGWFREALGSPYGVGMNPAAMAVGDLNGDGKIDVVVGNAESKNLTVLLGDGSGKFTQAPGSPFGVGKYPRSVAIADLDGDGNPDLAVVNGKSDNVSVLLGTGNGGFTSAPGSPFLLGSWLNPFTKGTWPFCVAIADFNEDGKLDLAVSDTNKIVTILLGDGKGNFTVAPDSPYWVGGLPKWVAVGDFNGDGKPDLAIVNRDSANVTILLNRHTP